MLTSFHDGLQIILKDERRKVFMAKTDEEDLFAVMFTNPENKEPETKLLISGEALDALMKLWKIHRGDLPMPQESGWVGIP